MENQNTGSAPVQSTNTEVAAVEEIAQNSGDNDGFAAQVKEKSKQKPEDEIRAKALTKEEPKEEKPQPKKYKVKVNGQDQEVDEEELVRTYSKEKAADQKFAEAAKIRKQAEEFLELLEQDPIKVLENPRFGKKAREVAEQYLAKQLQEELLSPEQRERKALEAKIKSYEEREAIEKKTREEQEFTQKVESHKAQFEKTIKEALEVGGLPKTTATVRRMAAKMKTLIENQIDMHPNDLSKMVKEEYLGEQKEILGSMDGETLLAMLGEDIANKIRKADLARLRKPTPVQVEKAEPSKNLEDARDGRKFMSIHEWREDLNKRLK